MTEEIGTNKTVGDSCSSDTEKESPIFLIMQVEEFCEKRECFWHYKELLPSLGVIRYCKAEVFKKCILGTIRIPQKNEQRHPQISFGFYLTEQTLYLIEDTGDLKGWVDMQMEKLREAKSCEQFLLQLMEQMTEKDILYLTHLEKEMEMMEERLLHSVPDHFFATLTKYRKKLSEFNAYYEQLIAISDRMHAQDSIFGKQYAEQWDRYGHRMERFQNQVQLLRDNVIQLRELYQSQQDAQQNKVMCILTVVTTLFLPLTLLTGWYGMNFLYMPELTWKYGYLSVGIAAILLVTAETVYFKKKNLF